MGDAKMPVTVSVRSLALLNLFQQAQLSAADSIALSELEQQWKDTGLRHSDLLLGLQELAGCGSVQIQSVPTGEQVSLTADGYERIAHLSDSLKTSRSELAALATLMQVGRRDRSSKPGFGRRASDYSEPEQDDSLQ